MYVKEKFMGRELVFYLGKGVSEELKAMKVLEAFMVKKGSRIVAIAGKVKNGSRIHSPVVYFSSNTTPTFYCGGQLPPDTEVAEALKSRTVSSDCWRGKTNSNSLGCKHALVLLRAITQMGVIPQVIQLGEEDTNDDELLLDLKATAFRVHLLLWGEPGSGKTWAAFKLAEWAERSLGAETIVIQGSPALEAADLLGLWLKKGDNVGWEDGALTRAFRSASSGRKVVLLVDELPRINVREQGVLIAPLLPTPKGLILYNPLNGEEIIAPPQNLWCIATGNLGERFASRLLDGALAERFLMIEVKVSRDKLRRLVASALLSRGWDTNIVEKLLSLRDAAEELVERGELPAAPSLRVFLRAIELAPGLEELPKWVAMCHSQVVLSPESKELWERLVKKVFSAQG